MHGGPHLCMVRSSQAHFQRIIANLIWLTTRWKVRFRVDLAALAHALSLPPLPAPRRHPADGARLSAALQAAGLSAEAAARLARARAAQGAASASLHG